MAELRGRTFEGFENKPVARLVSASSTEIDIAIALSQSRRPAADCVLRLPVGGV
jgi:hypothetical protein